MSAPPKRSVSVSPMVLSAGLIVPSVEERVLGVADVVVRGRGERMSSAKFRTKGSDLGPRPRAIRVAAPLAQTIGGRAHRHPAGKGPGSVSAGCSCIEISRHRPPCSGAPSPCPARSQPLRRNLGVRLPKPPRRQQRNLPRYDRDEHLVPLRRHEDELAGDSGAVHGPAAGLYGSCTSTTRGTVTLKSGGS